jgi:hypothetical protein
LEGNSSADLIILYPFQGNACLLSYGTDLPIQTIPGFLMLHFTAEFLNLKALGEGIVKTVGLDHSFTRARNV